LDQRAAAKAFNRKEREGFAKGAKKTFTAKYSEDAKADRKRPQIRIGAATDN